LVDCGSKEQLMVELSGTEEKLEACLELLKAVWQSKNWPDPGVIAMARGTQTRQGQGRRSEWEQGRGPEVSMAPAAVAPATELIRGGVTVQGSGFRKCMGPKTLFQSFSFHSTSSRRRWRRRRHEIRPVIFLKPRT